MNGTEGERVKRWESLRRRRESGMNGRRKGGRLREMGEF